MCRVGFKTKKKKKKKEGKKTITDAKSNIFCHTHSPRIEAML
jgi:hypothetical protein